MKKLIKILGMLLLVVVLVAVVGLSYLYWGYPKVSAAEDISIEPTPERLARGSYLVNHVSSCTDCHSDHHDDLFGYPIVEGTEGKGGQPFGGEVGEVSARNITPAALGDWTDGEILRAITGGVRRDGSILAPMMPYSLFSKYTREDARSVVAYLRTLKPIENQVPDQRLAFPVNLIFRTIPADAQPTEPAELNDPVSRGQYLVTIAGCGFCHTMQENGQPVAGMEFAGGHDFPVIAGTVRSANITPDEQTGLGGWTREAFINRFKIYQVESNRHIPVAAGEFNTVMGWMQFAGMTEEDLSDNYDYLRTVKPVHHVVEKFTPAP